MVVKTIEAVAGKISNWLIQQPVVVRLGVGVPVIAAGIVIVLLALVVIIPVILVTTLHIEFDKKVVESEEDKIRDLCRRDRRCLPRTAEIGDGDDPCGMCHRDHQFLYTFLFLEKLLITVKDRGRQPPLRVGPQYRQW